MIYLFRCETCHAEMSLDLSKTNDNVTEIKGPNCQVLQYIFSCPKCGTRQAESSVRVEAKGNKTDS
jgi:hypothetical protein